MNKISKREIYTLKRKKIEIVDCHLKKKRALEL